MAKKFSAEQHDQEPATALQAKKKPIILNGKTFYQELVEKSLEQGARKDYPQQPFLYGYEVIHFQGTRYASQMPLTEGQKALVEQFVGRPWNPRRYLRRLKSLLVQRCNVQNPDGLVWDDILTHIVVYLQEQQRVPTDLKARVSETQQPTDAGGQDNNKHSVDFTSVCWEGKEYQFKKTQARCVGLLWDNLTLSEKTIGEKIESDADHFRLQHVFRSTRGKGMHPAWGKMIVRRGKGIFGLNRPAQ